MNIKRVISCIQPQDEKFNMEKIEGILIDIQKAEGNYNRNVRQVAFNLPPELNETASSNSAKSLVSCLSNGPHSNNKSLKLRARRQKSPLPDVVSWPSDSDITVLRLKLGLGSSELQDNVCNAIPGDGLHQPDSSSMINLATLVLQQTQHPSKHCVNVEEYLLPLSSWEQEQNQLGLKESLEKQLSNITYYEAQRSNREPFDLSSPDSGVFSTKGNKKSKLARFLRLYFCPCCTCLYNLERLREESSVYFTKRQECVEIAA